MKIPLGLMSMIYADVNGCVTLSNEDTEALVRCLEVSIAQYLNTRQKSTPDATIPGRTQFTEFCNKSGFDAAERHGAVNAYNFIFDWINERNKVKIED